MRVFDNGGLFTVECSERDVLEFARKWPCFGKVKPLWFCFDKRDGDLVDTNQINDEQDDAGVVALSQDAQSYGLRALARRQRRLGIKANMDLPPFPS